MGFRFRRSIRLGKFARLNLSAKGIGASVGVKGFRLGVGPRGTRMTAGIPGTGLSYSTGVGGRSAVQRSTGSGCGCFIALVLGCVMLAIVGAASERSPALGATVLVATPIALIWWGMRRARQERNRAAAEELAAQQAHEAAEAAAQQARAAHEAAAAAEQRAREDAAIAARQAREAVQRERQAAEQKRWNQLCERFGHESAQRIWKQLLWIGAPREAVEAMFGHPLDVDERATKKTYKLTLKYFSTGTNRYALRVFLEDGVVAGWEDKR